MRRENEGKERRGKIGQRKRKKVKRGVGCFRQMRGTVGGEEKIQSMIKHRGSHFQIQNCLLIALKTHNYFFNLIFMITGFSGWHNYLLRFHQHLAKLHHLYFKMFCSRIESKASSLLTHSSLQAAGNFVPKE